MLHVNKTDRAVLAMILFHTYGWSEQCFLAIKKYLPTTPLLVIDNNPHKDDPEERFNSYQNSKRKDLSYATQWDRYCDVESHWIRQQEECHLLTTKTFLGHPYAINYAIEWCHKQSYDVLVLIEPDCLFSSHVWYDNLVGAIRKGYWMAGGHQCTAGELHPCPSAWNLHALKMLGIKFGFASRDQHMLEKEYDLLVRRTDWDHTDVSLNWMNKNWDTGLREWYLCAKRRKAIQVDLTNFHHFWGGSRIGHRQKAILML